MNYKLKWSDLPLVKNPIYIIPKIELIPWPCFQHLLKISSKPVRNFLPHADNKPTHADHGRGL